LIQAKNYATVISLTTDDNEMPNAPMMKELADLTLASADDSSDILDSLLGRVESDAALTKIKALRLVKFMCNRARPDFQIELQRKTDSVRQCLSTCPFSLTICSCFAYFIMSVPRIYRFPGANGSTQG
jgi:hypothetical protein